VLREGGSQKTESATRPIPDQRQDSQAERQEAMNNCPAMAWALITRGHKALRCGPSPAVGDPAKKMPCSASTTMVTSDRVIRSGREDGRDLVQRFRRVAATRPNTVSSRHFAPLP